MHCTPCHANDDASWKTAPITDEEIEALKKKLTELCWYEGPRRANPNSHVRLYENTSVSVLALMFREYLRLREKANV